MAVGYLDLDGTASASPRRTQPPIKKPQRACPFGNSGAGAEAELHGPPMRFVARVRPSDDTTLGKMAGLTEISAMDSFEALAIVVVFVLAAVVVTTLMQTRRR